MSVLLVILTQDIQVYAEILLGWTGSGGGYEPPEGDIRAADYFATASDGVRIHFRRWEPLGPPQTPIRTAILHHGNAGTMSRYRAIPNWLTSLGIATYVYDYRGYGLSTGFPSERGLYRDAEAIWAEARSRDNATPETTLTFAHSLGSGPASYLAEKYNFNVLITAAAYTSIPDRAALHPLFGALAPFVWTSFPTAERVSNLTDTCLIVLHAANDQSMPRWMADKLVRSYKGNRPALFAEDPQSSHGSIASRVPILAAPLLKQCFDK